MLFISYLGLQWRWKLRQPRQQTQLLVLRRKCSSQLTQDQAQTLQTSLTLNFQPWLEFYHFICQLFFSCSEFFLVTTSQFNCAVGLSPPAQWVLLFVFFSLFFSCSNCDIFAVMLQNSPLASHESILHEFDYFACLENFWETYSPAHSLPLSKIFRIFPKFYFSGLWLVICRFAGLWLVTRFTRMLHAAAAKGCLGAWWLL